MQLFQQWLQVIAVTLHVKELEEQKRRGNEDRIREARRRTRRQRTQWVRQSLLRRPMYGQKLTHELTTEDQTSFKNFLRVNPNIFMELLYIEWARELTRNDARRSSDPYSRSVLSVLHPYCLYAGISTASVLSA